MTDLEQILPAEKREEIRRGWLAESRFYSPWLHLMATTSICLGGMALAVFIAEPLAWWHVLFGVGLFIMSNAAEWRLHKDVLHVRRKPVQFIYDRHTPQHHMVFITDDMEMKSRKEWKLVLMPSFGILMLFLSLLPAAWLIYHAVPFRIASDHDQHNLAAVFLFVTMFYVVSYEWLHLAHHLPAEHPVARMGVFKALKRHHAIHHDPRLMRRFNFNVNLPLWDYVRGTVARDQETRPSALGARPSTAPSRQGSR
jgi:hypothetical protein